MAENDMDLSQYAEIDYCLRKYYDKNLASILSSVVKDVNRKKAEELQRVASETSPLIGAGSAFPGARDQFILQRAMRSEWGSKTTKDMMDMAASKMLDGKALQDIGVITDQWRTIFIERMGEAKYVELSEKCGQDLATTVVLSRLNDLMKEQIARSKVPKSSFEYIMQKGFNESLVGVLAGLQSMPVTSVEDFDIEEMTEKMYNPSGGEKVAGHAIGLLLDSPTLGVFGKGAGIAAKTGTKMVVSNTVKRSTGLVIDGGFRVAQEMRTSRSRILSSEEVSEIAFGDKNTMQAICDKSRGVKADKSDIVQSVNSRLEKKFIPFSYGNIKSDDRLFNLYVKGNGSEALNLVRESLDAAGLSYNPQQKIPEWMKTKMTEESCIKNAGYLLAAAREMKAKGRNKFFFSKELTLSEVTQRAYDYARAADYFHRKNGLTETEALIQRLDQGEAELRSMGLIPTATNDQQGLTETEALVQRLDQGEADLRSMGLLHTAVDVQQGDQQPSAGQGQGQYQQQPLQQQAGSQPGQAVMPDLQNMQGWGDLLENMGFGSLTHFGEGFGETLSVMPELLYGLFTGKIKNFRMEDNLLPLGLLMAGLFVNKRSHPILKLLLLALGGLLLLGDANDAVHGREKTQIAAKPTYRRYEEEDLDPRIKDPHVIGNTLVAEIDGHHLVLTINEDQVLDAYGKGVIPLNNLCNAALRSYDEQGGISARYERDMALSQEQEEERVRGIR